VLSRANISAVRSCILATPLAAVCPCSATMDESGGH